ncbi:MAG: hypothetical protein Q9214_003034, partial [Letrouitia sp. 1 TL-2023]
VEVNFLCIHKKLRSKRLAPVLIQEITRRIHLQGIFHAVYTAGIVLPKPVSSCRYFHRSLDWLKLYEVGFSPLPEKSTKARQVTKYHLPGNTSTKGLRPMQRQDVPAVQSLLGRYLKRFVLAPDLTEDEVEYWLYHDENSTAEQVIWSYVVEDSDSHKITDFFSFYCLESSVINNPKHDNVRAAYMFYYATETAFADKEKGLKERLNGLMTDALILAKRFNFDVFNALTLLDNPLFLEQLKFGPGDGQLHYYLYNYRTLPIAGGVDSKNSVDDQRRGGPWDRDADESVPIHSSNIYIAKDAMPGQSSGQTPRLSTSSQSSTSPGSSLSNPNLGDAAISSAVETALTDSELSQHRSSEDPRELNEDYRHNGRRVRRSGGFLLDRVALPKSEQHAPRRTLKEAISETKGKRKVESAALPRAESGSSRHRHQMKPSIGSSPLSTVAYSTNSDRSAAAKGDLNPDEIVTVPSNVPPQDQVNVNGGSVSRIETESQNTLGLNTDPAQIVNIALSLGESRRRNFSNNRFSSAYPSPSKQHVSSGLSSANSYGKYSSTAGINLRQYLQDQRQVSRNVSSRSSTNSYRKPLETSKEDDYTTSHSSNSSASPVSLIPDAVTFKPSDATLLRAEKARVTLELLYQYRRSLQHLSDLPIPSDRRPGTTTSTAVANHRDNGSVGRAYNPLQYIRNREIRRDEQKMIDLEAEKWQDLERVKLWVDTIANKNAARLDNDKVNKTSLPPLESVEMDSGPLQPSPDSVRPNKAVLPIVKSRRGEMYWMVNPWDLFADTVWLDHDENVNLITKSEVSLKSSNEWDRKTATPRTSLDAPNAESKRSLSSTRPSASEKPHYVVGSGGNQTVKDRSRVRGQNEELESPARRQDGPRDRKSKWHRNFVRSRSLSSSDSSETHELSMHLQGYSQDQDRFNSVALKQMRKMLEKEMDGDVLNASKNTMSGSNEQNALVSQSEKNQLGDKKNKKATGDEKTPEKLKSPFSRSYRSPRTSLDGQRGRPRQTSPEGRDDKQLKSSSVFNFGPSIFVNRSAPNSRSVSPKKPLPARIGHFRRQRSSSRRAVSESNFEDATKSPIRDMHKGRDKTPADTSYVDIKKSASSNNLLSPVTAELFGKRFRRVDNSSASIKLGRDLKDPDSKLRGLLKGGRIAELMGHEVSRVGDMIWRRDGGTSQINSPMSATGSVASDTEEDASGLENSPEDELSRTTTYTEDGENLSRKPTKSGPKYHFPNLPNFRSANTVQSPESQKMSSEDDHISRQQRAQRAQGRSSRWHRLAPPKIDMRNVSPSASPPLSRVQTQDSQASYNNSRATSTSRSGERLRKADKMLNDVLGIPGSVRSVRNGPPPTGLAQIDNNQHRSRSPPRMGERQWSISNRSVSNVRGTVTKREIARVRALLLSSGIKANEISRRSHEIYDPPVLTELRDVQSRSTGPVSQVPRRQEHLLAAKLLVGEIEFANQRLRDAAEIFSNTRIEELHNELKTIDERVTHKFTPQIRASADDADGLITELTTTFTLAVKRVNDSIDLIFRRRRRKFRWLRRAGFVLLEWTLLGIMWWVWFMVVIFRLVRGTLMGFIGLFRWFFWL